MVRELPASGKEEDFPGEPWMEDWSGICRLGSLLAESRLNGRRSGVYFRMIRVFRCKS